MTSLQLVTGSQFGLIDDYVDTFKHEDLRNAILHLIIIDNQILTGLCPSPNYKFDPLIGEVKLFDGNSFGVGEKCIFLYSKCNCN